MSEAAARPKYLARFEIVPIFTNASASVGDTGFDFEFKAVRRSFSGLKQAQVYAARKGKTLF